MDKIIASISGIEEKSARIMEDANLKKAEIANEINETTKAFDAQLDADTEKKLADLKNRLEQEMQEKLDEQKSAADRIIAALENHYNSNRKSYIDKLFADMIRE